MSQEFRQYIRTGLYEESLTGILTALAVSEGVIKLSGKTGVGKTALCERLAAELEAAGHEVLLLLDPPASSRELELIVARRLGLDEGSGFTRSLTRHLLEHRGSRLVVIVDDAERMAEECFLALRLMANIQDDSRSLVQLMFCGAPALDAKLSSPAYRSLAQYLNQSFQLRPMNRSELDDFCQVLMERTGLERHGLESDAIKRIHRLTGGLPGEVLALWNNLLGFREILPSSISGRAIRTFVRDARAEGSGFHPAALAAGAGGILAVAAAAFWGYGALQPAAPAQVDPSSSPVASAGRPGVQPGPPVEAAAPEETAPDVARSADVPETAPPPGLSETVPSTGDLEAAQSTGAPEPAAPVAATTPPAPAPSPEAQLEAFLDEWLGSWQRQELEALFSHYHEEFTPFSFSSVEAWRRDRREKVPGPAWIDIGYDGLEVVTLEDDRAVLRFRMRYASPDYEDETLKELSLRFDGERWRIVTERNLEVRIL